MTSESNRLILWVPLGIAGIFILFFGYALFFGNANPQQQTIESRMVGQPVPEFALDPAVSNHPGLTSANLATGEPRLVNVFASWCLPCITEAPQLTALQQRGVSIDAIAIRDRPQDISNFLMRYGDPYQRIGADVDSRVQLAFGSSGVPETFVVDGEGVIRHQHIGEIRPEDVPVIMQALEDAR
ncbi:MAG: DsbE family thiol:disulfide interchange protein [Parasphingopyxis sp.]|uniref:DsbE family thiol:disulfide interchange protein n=1 Tax=Parasphingopyxis sp. TaxID=1920299 RepID=UPI0032EBA661